LIFAGDFRDGYAISRHWMKSSDYSIMQEVLRSNSNSMNCSSFEWTLKAKQNDSWGIVIVHGRTVVPFVYDAIGDFSSDRALVVRIKNVVSSMSRVGK